jgi:biotin carboxyl carrier protein
LKKRYKIYFNGGEYELEHQRKAVNVKGHTFKPEVLYNGKFYRVLLNGREYRIDFKDDLLFLDGKEVDFNFRSNPQLLSQKSIGSKKTANIKAAIPGKIVEIKVSIGDEVKDQQCLLILESMKMRNEILSPISGFVEKISISVGDQVTTRQLMIKIKPK